MEYLIMRRNEVITVADFSENGHMLWFAKKMRNEHLAPLQEQTSGDWLIKWWNQRSVPVGQIKLEETLQNKGLISSEDYLLKNLGLSLNDYYWIKPLESNLRWEDVNLFQNNFANEIIIDEAMFDSNINKTYQYTPNSSLQGQLEKKWIIINEERFLIKSNCDEYSTESINECIATKIHKLQGYDNFTKYNLVKIKDAKYDYGCMSHCFTNERLELVSAYGVVTSKKKPNDISYYEHFINVCNANGINVEQLRMDLEYQIQTDFILSNRDRHLNNVSILRDADTLKFVRMAPIYDNGKSMFIKEPIPENMKEMLSIKTESFASDELHLLEYVRDRKLVDITKLPDVSWIKSIYSKDSQMSESRINQVCEAYERKIDLYRRFQLGEDLTPLKFFISK